MSQSAFVSDQAGRGVAVSPRRPFAFASHSDERLVRLVAKNGQAPFAELYERYHQALYRYCRSIVRDEHDAQDALQSTMAGAFAALRKGERDLAVRPWLFRIAHNESVSLLRRRRPREMAADELALMAPANTSEPASVVEQHERLALLLVDLRGLTVRQRSVLVMRELSGLSIGEIAEACSTTPGAVKQTLFEAREALRECERGRSMECEQVRRLIYEEDRRALRGRRVRSHLRACAGCHELAGTIATRGQDLQLLAPPLSPVIATSLLARLLGTGASVPAGATSGVSVGAASGTQVATAGSSATGAATSGAGPAAAGGTASGVAAHAGTAIAAKVLTTAAVLAVGAVGVAGVSSSRSRSHVPLHRRTASSVGSLRHGDAAHHFTVRLGATLGAPEHQGQSLLITGKVAKKRPLTSVHGRRVATAYPNDRSRGAACVEGPSAPVSKSKPICQDGGTGVVHESPGQSVSALARAKVHPNANHASSHGSPSRSKHAANPNRASEKDRSEGHRSSAPQHEHASHERAARGKQKPAKEADDGHGDGHGKRSTASGTVESEAGTAEAPPPSEHGKGAH